MESIFFYKIKINGIFASLLITGVNSPIRQGDDTLLSPDQKQQAGREIRKMSAGHNKKSLRKGGLG